MDIIFSKVFPLRLRRSNPQFPLLDEKLGKLQSFFLFIDCLKVNFRQSISKNVCSANSSLFEVGGVRIIWAVAGINGYYIFNGIPASAAPFESEILAIRCEIGKFPDLLFLFIDCLKVNFRLSISLKKHHQKSLSKNTLHTEM